MNVRRILLVFDECGPGDGFRVAFALSSIRASYPEAEITVLVGEQAAEVFTGSAILDRVVISRLYVPVPRPSLRGRIEKLREIARLVRELGLGYDLALTFWWGSRALNLLTFLVARRRIGYSNGTAWMQSSPLGRYDPLGDGIAQNLELLAAAGVRPAQLTLEPLARDDSDAAAIEEVLRGHLLDGERTRVVFHTGSDWACQQWSVGSWARLADRVIEQYGVDVLLSGSASEQSYVDEIRALMRHPATSVCGETVTLSRLSLLLATARLCVTVDAVPCELAIAEGVPVIVLSGPTAPSLQLVGRASPLVINNTAPELRHAIVRCKAGFAHGRCHDYSCPMSQLQDIGVDEVLARIADSGALGQAVELKEASR